MLRLITTVWTRLGAKGAALGVVALAFLMRVERLADKSIWWDEGWTIWLSQHDLDWIALRTASDEHPPLHYWLMHFWNAIGTEAAIGRFFSLFFGVLAVALLYRIAREIGGKWLGVLAALLLALARFHIWWSQDIKNYTLSGFFALASVWFVLRLVLASPTQRRAWRIWIGYVLSITLALYSHYLAALIFLADNLLILIVLVREWRGQGKPTALFLRWCLAQIAVLALFAPWLWLYLQNAATWSAAPAFDAGLFLRLVATVLALGVTTYIDNYTVLTALFTVLVLAGALWPLLRRRRNHAAPALQWGTLLALIIVLVPPLLIYILSLTPAAFFAPKIQARYLLILLPAYMLLLAMGIAFLARVSRYLAAAAILLVLAAQVYTLGDYYSGRVLQDDYASIAQAVNSFALPGDALVLDTDQEWPTFLYYLRPGREWPWVGVPNGAPVDQATAHRVAAQAAQYQGAWLVTIPDALARDPQHLVEAELAQRWPKQYEQTFGNKRLVLYANRVHNVKDVPPDNFYPLTPRADDLDSRLRLIGLDLPVREAYAGDTIHVVTYWQSMDLVIVRTILAGHDSSPDTPQAKQETPISIGAHERVQADFVIPPDSTATEYDIFVHARLTQLKVGTIRVLPRSAQGATARPGATMTPTPGYRLGDQISLPGIDLPSGQYHPGDTIPLTLFWKADKTPDTSYTVFVHLLGSQYNPAQGNFLWGQIDHLPVNDTLPTTAWPAGQLIGDPYLLLVASNAPPGLYKIEVGLYDATGQRLRVQDNKGNDIGDSLIAGQVEIK
ncbi:MAG: glycosyltransferase family 39 protein [Anaerolineae bacterium]